MDVRCERCKTEYEFDDARITEAGVTVKCTTCSHVFKVKKKALVFTVPAKPEEAPLDAGAVAAPQAAAPQREWKVRQASGNVFSFKELTTLQKWIVERKVSRDDEISLTGESWKRLGNIAELASFFQVVDEATKGNQLAAMQAQAPMTLGAPAYAPPAGYAPPGPVPEAPRPMPMQQPYAPQGVPAYAPQVYGQPQPGAPQAYAPPPGAYPTPGAGPPPAYLQPPPSGPYLQPMAPQAQAYAAPGSPVGYAAPAAPQAPVGYVPAPESHPAPAAAAAPAPKPRRQVEAEDDELEAAAFNRGKGGNTKRVVVLAVLAALGGGGYVAYTSYWLPEQQRLADEKARLERERLEKEKVEAEAAAKAQVLADAAAKAKAEALAKKEAEERAAREASADAGAADAGLAKAEPKKDFNYYMGLGDKLREREKAEQALDAYGKAVDLKPERAEPVAGKGLALLDMGQAPQAEAAFEEALKLNGRYGVALMGLAEALRAQNKKDQAIKAYEKYLEELPNGAEANVAKTAIERLKE